MIRSLLATVWLLTAMVIAIAQSTTPQTNSVFLEKRGKDWWAVWTNTPVQFKISTSSNLVNWQVWMSKHSGPPLVSFEMMLVSTNDFKFLKFEPMGYPAMVSTNISWVLATLTNQLGSNKVNTTK